MSGSLFDSENNGMRDALECPTVSIGMPVYNCARTLDIAIRSIVKQTFPNWELLLIDDGSADETVGICRSFCDPRVQVIADGAHKGLVARLNQAIDLSRGRYFARMDGDDVCYPERLALQVEYLEEHPEIDLLGGNILVICGNGRVLGSRELRITHEQICRRPWAGFYLAHPTWVGRREWFQSHRYRPEAVRSEDQELLLRTYEHSRFAALPRIILGYREESYPLRKFLLGRYSFALAAVRAALPRRKYAFALAAIVEQSFKGLVECVAVGTRLRYRVLRHRARPVHDGIHQRWLEVWTDLQDAAAKVPSIIPADRSKFRRNAHNRPSLMDSQE